MKATSLLCAAPLFILVACSSDNDSGEKKIISVEKKEVLKAPVKVAANQSMTVLVKGMSCEHACGGSIRMALKETGGVDRCSFDFKEDRPENKAIITYDDKKITPKKIISIIETINEKQFTTSEPTVKPIQTESGSGKSKDITTSKESAEVLPQKVSEEEIVHTGGGQSSLDYSGVIQLFSHILTIQ